MREAQEEAGLLLRPDRLITLSHWTTPFGRNRRFATWFFLAAAPEGGVVIDDGEIRAFEWHTLDAAISGCESGQINLAGPTYVSLVRLRHLPTVAAALGFVDARTDEVFRPRLIRSGDVTYSVYDDDPAYDSDDLDRPGPRHRMQMLEAGYRYINEIDPPAR